MIYADFYTEFSHLYITNGDYMTLHPDICKEANKTI